jgi:hypothetical protein
MAKRIRCSNNRRKSQLTKATEEEIEASRCDAYKKLLP